MELPQLRQLQQEAEEWAEGMLFWRGIDPDQEPLLWHALCRYYLDYLMKGGDFYAFDLPSR